MNRQQKPIRATLLFTLLFTLFAILSGCGNNEDGGELPKQEATPPSPLHLITARDGFAQLAPGAQGGINLAPYVTANPQLNVEVSEVHSLNRDQACGEAEGVNNGTRVGFTTQLDGSAMCRYQYTVEGQAASGETVSASAEVRVVGSTATNALLPPIPAAMVLASNASPSTLEIDLSAELSKLGDRFPTGYTLSSDVSILGDGSAMANQPAAGIIRYQAASIGPQRLIYTLEDSSGNAEHKFGAIDIAVSDEINQPPYAGSKIIYPQSVTVGQSVDIDITDYVTSPDGDDFSINYVNSFTATVTPKSPQDETNKVFTFTASVSGEHYVSYAVTDHNGGFASGIMLISALDQRTQALWTDITFRSKTYQAPLTTAEATILKAGASGRYYDNGYTPAVSVATFNIAEASVYCGSRGVLPTPSQLTYLPAPDANWPTERPYWAKDSNGVQLINLANGDNEPVTGDPKGYVTCMGDGSLVASAFKGYAIADNIDEAIVEATVTLGGVPKAGEVVNALISSGAATLSQVSGETDFQGKVRFNVKSDVVGTATVGMRFDGEMVLQNVEFRGDDRTARIYSIVTTLDEAYANPYSPATNAVEVTLVDITSNPVSGQLVSFSISGHGKLVDPISELITNNDGIVTANVTNDIGEAVTIVASYTNSSGDSRSMSETLTFLSPESVSIRGDSYSPALSEAESIKVAKILSDDTYVEPGVVGPRGIRVGMFNQRNAVKYCEQLDYDGKQGWRLPSIHELELLYDSTQPGAPLGMWSKHNWATSAFFWSSSNTSNDRFAMINLATRRLDHYGKPKLPSFVSCINGQASSVTVGNLTFSPSLSLAHTYYAAKVSSAMSTKETGTTGPHNMEVSMFDKPAAVGYCNQLNYDGKQDWRLPTKDELVALYDSTQPEAEKGMWTKHGWSTKISYRTTTDSTVNLANGQADDNSNSYVNYYVSCVHTD